MNDAVIAFQMLLWAQGYEPIPPLPPQVPFPSILKEMEDYVNSPEYKQLIINEQNQQSNETTN